MNFRFTFLSLVLGFCFMDSGAVSGQDGNQSEDGRSLSKQGNAESVAVREIKKVKPKENVFVDGTAVKPLVVHDQASAKKYFTKEGVAEIKKTVDLKKQVVFIFAWRGSGQDEMDFSVMKSDPPQVVFDYRRGRTRDLRSHTKVYVLRDDLQWKGKPVRPQNPKSGTE